jgi:hypothetical protein
MEIGRSCLAASAGHRLVIPLRHRRSYLWVGWFWFLGTLVPMIGVVRVGDQAMADGYAYLSFIGLFLIICWGLGDLADSWRVPNRGPALAGLLTLALLATATYHQLGYSSDKVTLCRELWRLPKKIISP